MIKKCLHCGSDFEPTRKTHVFCSMRCRITANNAKKGAGIILHPAVMRALTDLADAHQASVEDMANVMLWRTMNPDGQPLRGIWGEQEAR